MHKQQIYMVYYHTGIYEDHMSIIEKIFYDFDRAQNYCFICNKTAEDLGINKNGYNIHLIYEDDFKNPFDHYICSNGVWFEVEGPFEVEDVLPIDEQI